MKPAFERLGTLAEVTQAQEREMAQGYVATLHPCALAGFYVIRFWGRCR